MRKRRVPQSNIQKYMLNLDNFSGATNTVISEARLGKKTKNFKYAIESNNLIQEEDGIWQTRPGTANYGVALPADIEGATEFDNNSTGLRELIVVAGTKCYKSVDNGATWTEVTGASFTAGHKPVFLQYKDTLLISNREDALVSYDGSTLSAYSSLTDPASALTHTLGSGLAAGSFTGYYRYTANNNIGYTNPSPVLAVTTNKDRNSWVKADNEYVELTITAVAGATSYDIWYGTISGNEVYLGSTTDLVFRDYGDPVNPYREAPDDNTTNAPKFGALEQSGNRLWGTYDPDNVYRVSGSGTGQYVGYFSPFYGGFYIDIEKGGKNRPIALAHYRTGKGDPIMTVFCSSASGQGAIFQIELTSITIGDTTFTVPIAYKLVGSIGADAPGSVVKVGDNIFAANKKAIIALRNKQQMFNVLAADDMIGPIRDKWESLNESRVSSVVGFYRSPRIYFSASQGSENDTTMIFDMERRNWNWSWNIGFKQFFEYTDTTNKTKFLAVPESGDRLVEISDDYTNDKGEAFQQSYISPLIPIQNKDFTTQAKIKEVIFELGDLKGNVTLTVLGKQKNKDVTTLGSKNVPGTYSNTGFGDDAFSDIQFSDTTNVPNTFTSKTLKKTVRVNKKLYYIQFKITSTTKDTFFKLLGIQVKGFFLPGSSPNSWD